MNDETKATTLVLTPDEERKLRFAHARNEENERIRTGLAEIAQKRREQDAREKAEAEREILNQEGRYWEQAVRAAKHIEAEALQKYEQASTERKHRESQLAIRVSKGYVLQPECSSPTQITTEHEGDRRAREVYHEERQLSPKEIGKLQREHTARAKAEEEQIEAETFTTCPQCAERIAKGVKYHRRANKFFCVPSGDYKIFLHAGVAPTMLAAQELWEMHRGDPKYLASIMGDMNTGDSGKSYAGVDGPNPILQGR